MSNIEQHIISFIQKSVALTIRLRWGFVIFSVLYAVYIYLGYLALFSLIIICTILVFIGYSDAENEDDEISLLVERTDELIRRIIEKIFNVTSKITVDDKGKYISLMFSRDNRAENRKIKYLLLCFLVILIISQYLFMKYSYEVISVVLIFLVSLFIKEQLLGYRIRKGLFGTNRTEARELIDFIIKNSDNLDFTDSNGNLRRALLPEAADAAEERIPGTLGEGAPA